MRRLLAILVLVLMPITGHCLGGWEPKAYHLVDDQTGQPLVTLPNGQPEPFLAAGGELLFLGFFTETEIKQDDPPPGRKFPEVAIGSRFKLRGEDKWVRVEKWCCDDYNWVNGIRLPEWVQYHRELTAKFERFGADELTGKLDNCSPFVDPPVFLFDPETLKPRWTKFYAIARLGFDGGFRLCERQDWHVFSFADIGSSLDRDSVLVKAEDARGLGHFLQVSAATGEIIGPNPSGTKAIDAADVLRFKDDFLRDNPCPAFTEREKQKKDRYKTTSTGRCYIDRRTRYEDAVMHRFLGEPTPPPEW